MQHTTGTLTIRRLSELDDCSLARLAELDSREVPAGPHLGVEIEGRLLAAISLETGQALADPFSRTAELVALLQLRSEQLRARQPKLSGLSGWARPAIPAPAPGRPEGGLLRDVRAS